MAREVLGAPPAAGGDDRMAQRIRDLQARGYTGTVWSDGSQQQMTNGVLGGGATTANSGGGNQTGGNQLMGSAGTQNQLGQAGGPLGQFAPWMTSGGVDAQNWQGLGGRPDLSFLNGSNWSQGGADPTRVSMGKDPFSGVQAYTDQAYGEATRQLDPQWQQQQATFDQQMVNRGIAPGSQAYEQARGEFDRSKNDAYGQARGQAMQQGLGAQNQMFQQGLAESGLSNELVRSLIGANTSVANQQLGGNASIMQQLLGGNQGIAQSIIGGNASRDAANASAGASMSNANLNYQLGQDQLAAQVGQQDFGNLMALLGMGQGVTGYNNNLLTQDQQRNQSFFGQMPNQQYGNVNVMDPYNMQYGGQMNQWQAGQNQQNAQNQQYAQYAALIASMYCSHEFKDTEGPQDTALTLEAVRSLPVDRWQYKGEGVPHIGTYAEDFNKALGLPESKVISIIDMLGATLGAVQELAKRVDRIDTTLEALARAA
jgi:hypothetical protein